MAFSYFLIALISYAIGSLPCSFIIAKLAVGKDLTKLGTGNIGAMNVKRATNSWSWFAIAMVSDGLKGFASIHLAKWLGHQLQVNYTLFVWLAFFGAVLGHNYSIYFYFMKGKLIGGKGLATAGGALLAYNWFFLAFTVAFALIFIFLTGYLLAGQVLVTIAFPIFVYFYSPKDFIYATLISGIIFLKHAPRLPGLFTGKEPKWNVQDFHQV
jgi:glycerol-3-phosphate acyltransferase PlsY